MFQRGKIEPLFSQRSSTSTRPLSEATEIFDTELDDDESVFEEDCPKFSYESVSAASRLSAPTPLTIRRVRAVGVRRQYQHLMK